MMRSMYSAITGLRSHQALLDVTANNIANVNTVGYKAERATFKDALLQTLQNGGAPVATTGPGGTNAKQIGLGVQLASTDNLMSQGAVMNTGQTYDLAIQGDGWFQVSANPGTAPTYYTRAGNFTRDANGDLVTVDGYYLMAGTAKINIPADSQSVSISETGLVSVVPAGGGTPTTSQIQLAKFPNDAGLERVGNNRWNNNPNGNAGTPVLQNPGTAGFGVLTPGALEMSNVDLAQEFTTMIAAQRGFQANSRVITTADEMLNELVNMKR